MDDMAAPLDELIAEATALAEHPAADPVALELVRDDLAAAVAVSPDATATADACAVVVDIERLLGTGARVHDLPLAS